MRSRLLLFSFLFVFSSVKYLVAQQFGSGLIFDDKAYSKIPKASQRFKFSDEDVPSYSLKSYCPKPRSQGYSIGSCVGWATGYAALTIAESVQNKVSNNIVITDNARSAMYIYLQIRVSTCDSGSHISDALELAKQRGVCVQRDFDNGNANCETPIPSAIHQKANQFRIKDYFRIFDQNGSENEKIAATKNSIRANKPVVIGMVLKPSFNKLGYIGHWAPLQSEITYGSHAMCVIGYDDDTRRFEIMNSWGTNWGKDGFFTISYNDYAELCKYGYQFTLNNPTPTPSITLKGKFDIKKQVERTALFQSEPVTYSNGIYNLSGMHVGDFIRLEATGMLKDKYVYVFSIKPNREVESLFPETVSFLTPRNNRLAWSVKEVPIVQANEMILEFPENKKEAFVADIEGEDYMCILYSSKEITDYGSLLIKIATDTSSDVWTKLSNALGSRLINKNAIQYSSKSMGFSVTTSSGHIAPIILRSNIQPAK